MRTEAPYHVLIFGLSSFRSLPQREQGLAIAFAQLGHHVDFIEIAPSLAGKTHALYNRVFSPLARDSGFEPGSHLPNLRVHTPPMLPTGFRNSLTPAIDRAIFRRWFRSTFQGKDFSRTIVMLMMPLWWGNYIDREFLRPRLLVYDICDSLEVQSRSEDTLRRLRACEHALASEAGLITYSAREMAADIQRDYPETGKLFLPNAVSQAFIDAVDREPLYHRNGHPCTIGYIGSTTAKWFDARLFLDIASGCADCRISVIGPVDRAFTEVCACLPNVTLHGYVGHDRLAAHLRRFDVAVIPFLDNEITRIVNPLKMYEYSAAGLPVVATRTAEVKHHSELLYLAEDSGSFISAIRRALAEDSSQRRRDRRRFAALNTWEHRARTFVGHIHAQVQAA
jgi:O-antigen biosynthesis protein